LSWQRDIGRGKNIWGEKKVARAKILSEVRGKNRSGGKKGMEVFSAVEKGGG